MFGKVLIANRGEIAVRIAQTLQEMGITAAVVASEPDRASEHVRCADEAYVLEGATASETYLRGDRIIDIATRHDVDAVHPGYGFLAENADFAQACADAGITFIGPEPNTIRAMGDKTEARRLMADAGVPIVPGFTCEQSHDAGDIARAAGQIGYPILVKAAAGGGGRGMRIVEKESDLPDATEAAQREAQAAFGDGRLFVEKYIESPRHVEFQVFGDDTGNVVHLFERECSIQRRYQKIIEETPSPALGDRLREDMARSAVNAATAIGYTNAGTVEFILDPSGAFYFLEVNTRLQVEHPVTEMTTGLDLVRMQIQIAAGQPLPVTQEKVQQTGHAIECRVYAEDPARGFLPSTGRIERWVPPVGANVRIDAGVRQGSQISVHYDPLLAKVTVWAPSRTEALARMLWALHRFVIMGVQTNIEFLCHVLSHPEFQHGEFDTHFLKRHDVSTPSAEVTDEVLAAAALGFNAGQMRVRLTGMSESHATPDPWQHVGTWRVG